MLFRRLFNGSGGWSAERYALHILLAGALSLLMACNKPEAPGGGQPSKAAAGGQAKRAGRVTTVAADTVKLTNFVDETEALGTTNANEAVDITAKSTNRVIAIRFREGQNVRKNDVLIEFDGAEARANLASAEASLRDTQASTNAVVSCSRARRCPNPI